MKNVEDNTDRSAGGARTLPRKYFVSKAIFQREKERIFAGSWICVGHVDHVATPGNYFLFDQGTESIIVTRDRNGEVRSFFNVCRHRGTQLCTEQTGQFAGKIQCRYHGWTYALDGRLIGAPNMLNAQNFDPSDYPLHYVPTAVWEGLIFLNLSRQPSSFHDVFSPVLCRFLEWQIPALKMVRRIVYNVRANWKLIFQNYSECYHCPTVHPLLASLTPYKSSANHLAEGPFLGGPMALGGGTRSMTIDGSLCATPIGSLCGENNKVVHYYTIFPSLFVTLNPDYVMLHRMEPLDVNNTRVICEFYFHPDAISLPDFQPEKAIEFWDLTNQQDWHVCELSQQGILSRSYTPGPYSDLESLLAAFDREYLRWMNHQVA